MNDPAKPIDGPAAQAGRKYLLKPTPSRQMDSSRRMIARAAEGAGRDRALVLGAGGCEEIPLAELADRFAHVTLNDIERNPLETALAGLPAETRAKIDVRVGDLTGVTDEVIAGVRQAIAECDQPGAAIEKMAERVAEQPARGMALEDTYDLLVASCLLSQLDFWLIHRAAEVFENRFPGEGEQLRGSARWTAAVAQLAERLQRRFIDDLAALDFAGRATLLRRVNARLLYRRDGIGRVADRGEVSDAADHGPGPVLRSAVHHRPARPLGVDRASAGTAGRFRSAVRRAGARLGAALAGQRHDRRRLQAAFGQAGVDGQVHDHLPTPLGVGFDDPVRLRRRPTGAPARSRLPTG